MENLDMQSPNLVSENIEYIAQKFPNCVTEGENGKVIDFDLLKQELSEDIVSGNKERYRLEWPGKKEAIVTANLPTTKTLRPVRKDSVDFDTTENIYIEGDNLEVLKILQESYLGKIKMIYIDPPYNTGKDFVYKDNFKQNTEDYKEESGQIDEYNQRLFQNPETSGRYHSDWLSMMYPRLKLARNLLTDDGVIFISIDDNEIENLRKICDEVFGKSNMIANFVWKTEGNFDNQARVKKAHEYILLYAKKEKHFPLPPVVDPSIPKTSKLFNSKIVNTIVKNGPKNPPSKVKLPVGFPANFIEGEIDISRIDFPRYNENLVIKSGRLTKEVSAYSGWSNNALLQEFIKNSYVPVKDSKQQDTIFYLTQNGAIEAEKNRSAIQSYVQSIISSVGTTQSMSAALKKDGVFFSYPKPTNLISYLLKMNEGTECIILDFFSGSASSAHATIKVNSLDSGKRKFIQVQLPEATDEKSEAYKAGYKNICEIGKERIRRAAEKIKEETGANIDYGFRVYRLDDSNMQDVYYSPQEYKQQDLELFKDNVKPDRTTEDLLTQVILDWGLPLSLKIDKADIEGKEVFKVAGNSLYACFDSGVDEVFAKAIAKEQPLRIVFKDASFKNDTAKENVKQLLKQLSPETEMRVI